MVGSIEKQLAMQIVRERNLEEVQLLGMIDLKTTGTIFEWVELEKTGVIGTTPSSSPLPAQFRQMNSDFEEVIYKS